MAKKSRTSSNSQLLSWPKVLVVIIPLFAAILIMFNSANGRAVLGVSDSNLLNLNREKTASSSGNQKCRINKVTAFSVTSLCDSNRNGFKQASYTCANGTTGSVSGNCISIQSAFEKAIKACARGSKCEKLNPSLTPAKVNKDHSETEKTHLLPTGTGL